MYVESVVNKTRMRRTARMVTAAAAAVERENGNKQTKKCERPTFHGSSIASLGESGTEQKKWQRQFKNSEPKTRIFRCLSFTMKQILAELKIMGEFMRLPFSLFSFATFFSFVFKVRAQ